MSFEKCETLFHSICKRKKLQEAVVYVENSDGSISWKQEHKASIDSPMCMASITKLFVTTCVLQLIEEHSLSLEDPLGKYLDAEIVRSLHVFHGKDYSDALTIRHLLFQTSGLPDYFFYKTTDGTTYMQSFLKNESVSWEQMLSEGKTMKKHFAPGKKGRAYYSDFNFDLLGKILENIEGTSLYAIVKRRITDPLSLTRTYILSEFDENGLPQKKEAPACYHKGIAFISTNYLRSFPASGGGISTARELMVFLKAFFTGRLFSKELFDTLKEHNRLQMLYGSVRYSGGHMYIHAGYPFIKKHTFRGHSGASGCSAYYCEESDLFFVTNLNSGSAYLPVNMIIKMEVRCR